MPLLLPAPAQEPGDDDVTVPAGVLQDDGEYITLDLSELDDGGLTLRQFIKICQVNTGINFTLDESSGPTTRQKLDSKKLLLYGRKKIRRDEFYSFFQIMMKIHGFVCVQQGSGDLAVVVITENLASNQTMIKSNAQFVEMDRVQDFGDKPGTFIYTVVKLKYAQAQDLGTNLRTAIGANTGDNSAFMPLTQEQALLVQGYGPFVAASVRMIGVLDVKPDELQPVFRKIPLREASADELADILTDLVENLQSSEQRGGRNTRNNQPTSTIIETNIASYSQDNSLLVTSDPETMEKILDLVAQLDTRVEEPNSNYHVYTLQYLSAADLDDAITQFLERSEQEAERVQRQASGGNNNRTSVAQQQIVVEVHEETNSLLVTATRTKWDELKSLLDRLDRRQPQVLIETALIEVSSDFSRDIGIEYAQVETPVGESQRGFVFTSVGITSGENIGDQRLPSPTAAGLTFGIFDGEDLGIPFIVNAALNRNDANVLSVPSVLVANNKGAVVTSEDQIPFQTSNAVQGAVGTNVEYTDAGITLSISPSISAEKYLRLNILLEVSSFRGEAQNNLPPPKATRSIQTSVTLPDGATMWLGGIIRDDNTSGESGIPYLSEIPLIGGLFGSRSNSNIKTTLYFFCTPRILDDFQELADLSAGAKARASETIGLERVRMIDPDYDFESPVDVILEEDLDGDGRDDLGTLNLSGFAAPSYSSAGGTDVDRSRVGASELMVPQGGR
ncbi:MAG: secretin N-terminal domain-containing protein [Planctomycetota bacterium]